MSVLTTSPSITSPPFHRTYTMFYSFCTVHYVLQLLAVFQLQNAFVYDFFSLSGFFFFLIDFFQFRWVFVPARGLSAVARKEGLLFITVRDLLIAAASLPSTGSRRTGSWSCGAGTLVVLWPVDSSPTRWNLCPRIGRQILICCTTGEVLPELFLSPFCARLIPSLLSCHLREIFHNQPKVLLCLSQPPACFLHSSY